MSTHRKEEEAKKRRALGDLGPDPGPSGVGRGRGRGRGKGRGRGGGRGEGRERATTGAATGDAVVGVGKREGGEVEGETPSKVARVDASGGVEASGGEGGGGGGGPARRLCTFYLKGRCGKGDECTFSHDVERKSCR